MDRRLIMVGVVAFLVLGLIVYGVSETSKTSNQPTGSAQFTDAITGQDVSDIVNQDSGLAADTIDQSTVSIDGIEQLYTYFTTEQAVSAQAQISQYLMARSGLENVRSGIKDNQITTSASKAEFTLEVLKPAAVYDVTVTIGSSFQTTSFVTIKEIE